MKYTIAIIFLIFFISCKSESENKIPKKHNPYEHIKQNLENEKAIELYFKGTDNIKNGNLKIARENLKQSFEIEKSPITLNELGTISRAEKKYQEALDCYNQSIALDKKYYPSHINKSIILAMQSDFKSAEKTLFKMLDDCDSEYWIAYANFYLATIYFNTQESCEKILKHFNKSKIIKEDIDLNNQFLSVEEKINKNCG